MTRSAIISEPLADGLLELEGQQLRAIELGRTDTDGTSALYVPSIGLVVAGDAHGPEDTGRTRRYIEDFTAAAEKARSLTGLTRPWSPSTPNRVNRGVLWNSAKSFMS